jgi:DEAD/DEAH box helicase domain-containing protein
MLRFIEKLKRHRYYAPQVVYHQSFPPQTACFSRPEQDFPPALARALEKMGIRQLYSHQVEAIEKVRGGKNVVIATPTASGKTLTYNLPVVEKLLQDPGGKALYLFPLKALEQDQLKAFREFVQPFQIQFPFRAEIYDGDTSSYRRKKIRESVPPVLISNPDMVHLSLLPFHAQ